jgi:hypothetical protein
MAVETVRIENFPTDNSRARVAFDIATKLAGWEGSENPELFKRQGFLDLYAQCYRAAGGVAHNFT